MENHSKFLQNKLEELVNDIGEFEILSEKILPFGLKPHTRSVCWLAEQVITQNTKVFKEALKINNVFEPISELDVWDYGIDFAEIDEELLINIKITDSTKPRRKNDMSSIKRLVSFFSENPNAHLLYAVFPFEFKKTKIIFSGKVITGYYSMMDDFVLNIRNQHLQAFYDVGQIQRTNSEFVSHLMTLAENRGLKV